ncbi:MAG: CPBP family intramembrane glutamic endopeptidase [Chitinophagales bacterium]
MITFQNIALLLIVIWLVLIMVWFRRASIVLVGGLLFIGLFTILALAYDQVTLNELGLGFPNSWVLTIGVAIVWLGLMLAYSPLADKLASQWFRRLPTLESFRVIQQSKGKLILGIVVAWLLGGVLEELIARGIVLKSIDLLLTPYLFKPIAIGVAICAAGLGAGVFHLYQGPRATAIVTQLSILFGLLFVISGYNLWAVILCHGLYDTIAFVRFSNKKSKYSDV